MGVKVKDTRRDTITEKTTVKAKDMKNLPMIPLIKATGRKMATMAR